MKTLIAASCRKVIVMMILIGAIQLIGDENSAMAQLPDCVTGTTMYGVFSPANPPVAGSDSTEIRPINYATGAVGALMGGRRYFIRKQLGGTWYYGTASLGLDPLSHRFFMMTQMGGGGSGAGAKDIITIDATAPTATGITIATTGVAYNDYHFVKMAIAPTGVGYAIGVHRDTSTAASTFSPLIRFNTCATTNCAMASLITLGYLPTGVMTYKQRVYNGDIAFDWGGNLYFLSAAFEAVGSKSKYTNARLFRIKAADIPSSAGTGIIPMTFIADYNIIDSTGVSGIALDATGKMFFSVKRFAGNDPSAAFTNELYRSSTPGSATLMGGLGPIPANTSLSDLASCFFPAGVLAARNIDLSSRYSEGQAKLRWQVDHDASVLYYELQRGNDEENFETIARIDSRNGNNDQIYTYADPLNGSGNKFYRIRENMKDGNIRYYSNVEKVTLNSKMNLITTPKPNPFINTFDFNVQLLASNAINLRVLDQSGRGVYQSRISGQKGNNNIRVDALSGIRPGIYIVEISVEDEKIREKLIKQ